MLIDATTQTVFGNVYYLTGNDDLNVAAGITITSLGASPDHDTEYDAVTTFQGQHRFTISGTVNGYDEGINTIGCEVAQSVEIFAGGVINSGFDSPVVDADGVILDGFGSTLINRGTINAQGSGVMLSTREFGTSVVTNFGTMNAEKYGVWVQYSVGTAAFINHGTVESGQASFFGGVKIDLVTNAGTMRGDVDLREGDDVYVGTGGNVVGDILGGAGNDRFVPGAAIDRIDGGSGTDTLDLSGMTIKLAVDLSGVTAHRGTGVVGDVYTGIEAILGGTSQDVLTGDGADNTLTGNAGRDLLIGGAGGDTLVGGSGVDTLTGGADADVFVFNALNERGDILTDFQTAFDLIRLEGSAFGFGTYAGPVDESIFVTATNNAALDAADRFIFRTTDATLWYDRDGTGTKAAMLLANLTDGLIVNPWDLTIA